MQLKPTLTLIRGLPGSGKSTLATQLAQQTGAKHLEADMYFIDEQGQYHFDVLKLAQAHQWCQQQTEQYLRQGRSVIVANTFVRHWEMKVYRTIAHTLGLKLEIKVCRGQYQNIHSVDEATVVGMKRRWQE